MNARTAPLSRWPTEDLSGLSTAATVSGTDYVASPMPALNGAYTLVVGVVAASAALQPARPFRYVYGQRPASPGILYEVPWFESGAESAAQPETTRVPVSPAQESTDPHDRARVAGRIAKLIGDAEQENEMDHGAFSDSFNLFLRAHGWPRMEFRKLTETWRNETCSLSDPHAICSHLAYQRIIGMGFLALPFILAELERKPDHWFAALRAITAVDPVPERDQGDLAAMARHWLTWANRMKRHQQ